MQNTIFLIILCNIIICQFAALFFVGYQSGLAKVRRP